MPEMAPQEEFALAWDLVELTERILEDGELKARRALSPESFQVRVGLMVKATQTLAATLRVLDSGFRGPAQVLIRSLLETSFCLEFLLRHSVRLGYRSPSGFTPLDLYGKKLTREFRTVLYLAHCVAQKRKWFTESYSLHERKGRKEFKDLLEDQAISYEQRIGSEWWKRIRKSPTCAGLSAIDLAKSLGKGYADNYNMVYRPYSHSTHAADAFEYAWWDADEDCLHTEFNDPDIKTRPALGVAIGVYWGTFIPFAKAFEMDEACAQEYERIVLKLAEHVGTA